MYLFVFVAKLYLPYIKTEYNKGKAYRANHAIDIFYLLSGHQKEYSQCQKNFGQQQELLR